jgi:hypothetical protein
LHALAELTMRGRLQACAVAMVGTLLPLISAAVIGLVTLRNSSKEGVLVLLWAALPLILVHSYTDGNLLLTTVSVMSLCLMVVLTNLLRLSASWQWVITLTVIASALTVCALGLLMSADFVQSIDNLNTLIAEVASGQETLQQTLVITQTWALGFIALILALNTLLSLFIARWWQALLYNPGGFQKEFHAFGLDIKVALPLFVVLALGTFLPQDYQSWLALLSLPLLLSGLSLLHFAVKLLTLGTHWLFLVYTGLLLLGSVVGFILVVFGFINSVIDLRAKLLAYKNKQS